MLAQVESFLAAVPWCTMGKVQDQQQRIAETQITKSEATLSDGHKFKRRGNEEQFKHNKILSKIKEADNVLEANNPSQEIFESKGKTSRRYESS